jgi:hypothetical protein
VPRNGPCVFLAGPTHRGETAKPSWRRAAADSFESQSKTSLFIEGTLFIAENREAGTFDEATMMDDQVAWEWKYLEQADAILFWVPRNMETLPGLTTNIEFGMYWDSGKVVVGWPWGAEQMGYFARLAERSAGGIQVCHEMRWAVYHAMTLAETNWARGYAR